MLLVADQGGQRVCRGRCTRRPGGGDRIDYVIHEREKLCGEVWAEPVVKVAEWYGVSDAALAKTCRKLRVPLPPCGHWAKGKVGKALRRPGLPPLKKGESDRVRVPCQVPSVNRGLVGPSSMTFERCTRRARSSSEMSSLIPTRLLSGREDTLQALRTSAVPTALRHGRARTISARNGAPIGAVRAGAAHRPSVASTSCGRLPMLSVRCVMRDLAAGHWRLGRGPRRARGPCAGEGGITWSQGLFPTARAAARTPVARYCFAS